MWMERPRYMIKYERIHMIRFLQVNTTSKREQGAARA